MEQGMGLWILDPCPWQHSSSNKGTPPSPYQIVPPTLDQVLKYMRACMGHSFKPLQLVWLSVHHSACPVPAEARTGHEIPGGWSYRRLRHCVGAEN